MEPGQPGASSAQVPTSPAPRDWSWVLVSSAILEAVGTMSVLATNHVNSPGEIAATDAGLMLLGLNFIVTGYLLFRRPSRVRGLTRLITGSPSDLGISFMCEGGGLIAADGMSIAIPQPSSIPFLCLIGGPAVAVVVVLGLRLLRRG